MSNNLVICNSLNIFFLLMESAWKGDLPPLKFIAPRPGFYYNA